MNTTKPIPTGTDCDIDGYLDFLDMQKFKEMMEQIGGDDE